MGPELEPELVAESLQLVVESPELGPEFPRLGPESLLLVVEHPQPGAELVQSEHQLRFPLELALEPFQSPVPQRFPWRVPLPLLSAPLQIACLEDCNRRLRSASSLKLIKPAKISS